MSLIRRYVGDLRYTVRSVARRPAYAGTVLFSLVLALSTNIAIFAFVDAALFRPFPYPDPGALVAITLYREAAPGVPMPMSYGDAVDLEGRLHTVTGLAPYRDGDVVVRGQGSPERLPAAWVSGRVWSVTGVRPRIGTPFGTDADTAGGEPVVVISDKLWRQYFGARPSAIGQTLRIDGRDRRVLAVMPPTFAFPENAQLWLPLGVDPLREGRDVRRYRVIARLRDGASVAQSSADARRAFASLAAASPATSAGWEAGARSFREASVGAGVRPILLVFQAAVGLVLVVACVNLISVVAVRTFGRQRELAVRSAVGATRTSLVQLLLLEGVTLSLLAGALALPLGAFGLGLLRRAIPIQVPAWLTFSLDGRAIVFALAASVTSGVAVMAWPVLAATRPTIHTALREGGRGATKGRHRRRFRQLLCTVQLALASLLMTSAILLAASVQQMRGEPTGFDANGVLTAAVALGGPRYASSASWSASADRLLERVRALPGVTEAAVVNHVPLGGGDNSTTMAVPDGRAYERGHEPIANLRVASDGFFSLLRIPVVQGGALTAGQDTGQRLAVVNVTLAQQLWGTAADALGRRLRLGISSRDTLGYTVVGVVRDTKSTSLGAAAAPTVYLPFREWPWPTFALLARTRDTSAAAVERLQATVRQLDRELPAPRVRTLAAVVQESLWRPKLYAYLVGVFGFTASVLAVIGVLGLASQATAERAPEYAIRAALGATPAALLRLTARDGALMTTVGVTLGALGSWVAARMLKRLIFGLGADALDALLLAAFSMAVAAALAYVAPAWKLVTGTPGPLLRGDE